MEKELTAREKFKEILDSTFIKNYDKPENNKEKIRIFCEKVQKLKPQKLFRYRKIDDNNNFYDALCKNLITTSNPINFNDPFDSLIYVNVQEILDDLKNPRSRTKFKKWLEYNPALVQSLQAKQKSILKGFLNESDDKYRLNIRVALPKIEIQLHSLCGAICANRRYHYKLQLLQHPHSADCRDPGEYWSRGRADGYSDKYTER